MRQILAVLLLPLMLGAEAADTIPDFRLQNLDRQKVSLHDLMGENLTVIDFWATWCGPCIRSIPALVDLSEEYEDQGVRFVGVNVDSPRNLSKVKPFARSLGVTYPVLLDPASELMAALNVTAMPTLLLVNADREVVMVHEGYRPGDEEIVRDEIERRLSGEAAE